MGNTEHTHKIIVVRYSYITTRGGVTPHLYSIKMVRTKEQINLYAKIYRDRNKEQISEKKKLYYKNFKKTDEWIAKKNSYMREYNKKNKKALAEKKAEYYKKYMSKEENKEKRRVYYRAYRLKNLEKHRAYDRKYIKKPEQRARRTQNLRDWRKVNPRKSTAYSMIYYYKNQKKVDATHKIWRDKFEKKVGTNSNNYYGITKRNTPIYSALKRAFGKSDFEKQNKKTIKNDIQILKREITKLKEKLKQWK